MEQFLNLGYYFSPRPNADFQFTKLTLAIGLILLLSGLALMIYRKKYLKDSIAKKILRPYPEKLMRYGFIALFLLLFRELGIPYLSMRIWWLVLLGFIIYRAIRFAVTYKKDYQKLANKLHGKKTKDKYLPKKKK